MANTYSIVRRQQPYIQPYDVEDIERTLDIKEGRYNTNKAQVDQAIASFSSIDLARNKDKEYLYNNLKTVIDIVDNTENIDFSRTGLGSELGMYISQAIDKNVLKQAANTKAIRNYSANLEEIKKKNPELYSQINDNDARVQGGYYDYMNEKKDELGSLNYVNFTDVQSNLMKKAKGLKDLSPDSIIKVPDGKGYFIEKQVKGLTQSEWLKVLPTMLTEQDRSQLSINGRVRYQYNDQAAMSDIQRLKDSNNKILTKSLEDIDAKIALIADENTTNNLRIERKQIKDYYSKTNASYDLIGKTAGKIGGFFLEQQLIGGMASSFGATENIKYSEDGSYWKKIKQDAESKSKLVGNNNFRDDNNDGTPDFQTTATIVNTSDLGNVLKKKEDMHNQIKQEFKRKLSSIYNSFDKETKKQVDAIEKQILGSHSNLMSKDPELKPLTDIELQREVVDRISLGDNSILTLQEKIDIKSYMDQIDAYNLAKTKAFTVAENILFAKNTAEIYEELTSNKNIGMFGLESGGTTFNQFLIDKGINSKEDLSNFLDSNSKEAKVFKANFLLQTFGDLRTWAHSIKGNANPQIGLPDLNRDILRRIKRAQELLGDNTPIEDIFTSASGNNITEEDFIQENDQFIKIKNTDSKLGKMLKSISDYSANIDIPLGDAFRRDRNLREESHIYSKFGQKEFTKEYERALNLKTANIIGHNIITIQPSGTRKGESVAAYEYLKTKANPKFIVGFDNKLPLNLEKNKDGTFTLFQNQTGKDGNIKTIGGILTLDDIAASQSLSEQVELYENKAAIDFNTQIRSQVPLLNYASTNAKNSKQLQDIFNANTPQGRNKIMMVSKDSVLDYLGTNLPGMNKKEKSSEYVSMVQKTLINPNKFSLKMDSYEGVSNIIVQMTNKEGEKVDIDSINLSNVDQKEFMNIYYATPQLFLTLALQNIGTEYIKTNNSSKIDLINDNL